MKEISELSVVDQTYLETQLEKYEEQLREKYEDEEFIKRELAKYETDMLEEVSFDDEEEEISDRLAEENCDLLKSVVYDEMSNRSIRYMIDDKSGSFVGESGGQAYFTLDDVKAWIEEK